MLVEAATSNCVYKTSPFNFETYGITYLSLNLDVVTGKLLTVDYYLNPNVKAFFGTDLAVGLARKDACNLFHFMPLSTAVPCMLYICQPVWEMVTSSR